VPGLNAPYGFAYPGPGGGAGMPATWGVYCGCPPPTFIFIVPDGGDPGGGAAFPK
jgi:hypothetical protein